MVSRSHLMLGTRVRIPVGARLGSPNACMRGEEIATCKSYIVSVILTDWSIMIFYKKIINTIPADSRTRSKHGHKFHTMTKNANDYKYSFFQQTISQWNCLLKALVDSETVDAFKQISTLVTLTTSAFILQWELLLISYSGSDLMLPK